MICESELEPPSKASRESTNVLRGMFGRLGIAPLRIAPDGDGGMVVERRVQGALEVLEVSPTGTVERLRYEGVGLQAREPFRWPG